MSPVQKSGEPADRKTTQSHCVEVIRDHEGNVIKMRVCRNQDGRAIIGEQIYAEHPDLEAVITEATEIAARDRYDCFLGTTEERFDLDVPIEPGQENAPARAGWLSGGGSDVYPVGVPPDEL